MSSQQLVERKVIKNGGCMHSSIWIMSRSWSHVIMNVLEEINKPCNSYIDCIELNIKGSGKNFRMT